MVFDLKELQSPGVSDIPATNAISSGELTGLCHSLKLGKSELQLSKIIDYIFFSEPPSNIHEGTVRKHYPDSPQGEKTTKINPWIATLLIS